MIKLQAEKRESFGKELAEARAAGKLPVVMYGRKEQAAPFFVDAKIFKKVLNEAGESSIVSLSTPEGDKDILIKQIDYHPVSGQPIHADLYAVEKGKPVRVALEIEFVGEAPAEKLGGSVVKVLHEVEIEALPKDLPSGLTVDLASLTNLDSQILVKDLKFQAGVTVITGEDEVIAAVAAGGEEVAEEPAAVDLSAIEVEKKGKKEEEESAAE
ncbi:MAG TPA: 50S ribosomal protein L25 [Candidatus Paceibacterota bacterium]|nr:50S ribosomal protein L25 [Candidatus Paceibacterota bacterium]